MKLYKKLMYILSKRNSDKFIRFLRNNGCVVGEYTHFHDPKSVFIDVNRLDCIEIGEKCSITRGVIILAHDFSYRILRPIYHELPQKFGITKIGNNVFVGMNSIILMGSCIGNNVIIGAGSVVSGNIPNDCVVAGNPAKLICTLDEYYMRCSAKFIDNANMYAKRFIQIHKRYPSINEMGFYSVLFLDKTEENKIKYFCKQVVTGDNKQEVINDLMKIEKKYESFDQFLNQL